MSVRCVLQIGMCGLLGATVLSAGSKPIAVSPGSATGTLIGDGCPTFSWAEVDGAKSYELVVYRIGEKGQEAESVLRPAFAGSVTSWTPSLDRCMERGGKYAWSVRAVGPRDVGDWSPPSLFEVASGPSEAEFEEALAVVRDYLRREAGGHTSGVGRSGSSPGGAGAPAIVSRPAGSVAPAPLAPAVGDAGLQVNGSAVVTVATLAGALCGTTEVRFLDLGNGTVLDCNTGKIWLKNATCLGTGTWDSSAGPGSVQAKVADLNSGTDFSCSGYTPGTYTDWEVPKMTDLCGMWDGTCSGTSCCTASKGIIDTSFPGPTVPNAAGDGQWSPDDAFVGVQAGIYWSATEFGDAINAWYANLHDGEANFWDKSAQFFRVWPVRGGQ